MTRFTVLAAATIFLALPASAPPSAMAANARHPYSNIDRRVDAGNDTGDAQVDALNQQQLNRDGAPGPRGAAPPVQAGAPIVSYLPPLGYAPPPVVYAPPPVVVAPYPVYRYYRPYRYYYPY